MLVTAAGGRSTRARPDSPGPRTRPTRMGRSTATACRSPRPRLRPAEACGPGSTPAQVQLEYRLTSPYRRTLPLVRRLATAVTAVLLAIAAPAAPAAAAPDDLPFASAVFRATHNSYSGNADGAKGSITAQLDSGVRFLEFDIHDNGYAAAGDYGIGHSSPGDLVDHTGNPASNNLRPWL